MNSGFIIVHVADVAASVEILPSKIVIDSYRAEDSSAAAASDRKFPKWCVVHMRACGCFVRTFLLFLRWVIALQRYIRNREKRENYQTEIRVNLTMRRASKIHSYHYYY
jgi:hypothetical protein